jgi:outer membrane protein TolC
MFWWATSCSIRGEEMLSPRFDAVGAEPGYAATSSTQSSGGEAALPPSMASQTAPMFRGPTSLEALVDRALSANPRIQAARFQAASLAAQVPQAGALPDPQLVTTTFLEAIQTAAGPQELAMSLSQKIPWFGKRSLRGQLAYQNAMAAYSRAAERELEIVKQVKHAYFDLYAAERGTQEAETIEPLLENVIRIARARYETNVENSGLDQVFQAEVELAKLKMRIVQLKKEEDRRRATLMALLHLPRPQPIRTERELPRKQLAETADRLVRLAIGRQPSLEAHRREIHREQSSLTLAQKQYYPDVTFGVNWYEIGNRGISPVTNGNDAFSVTAGVNLPLNHSKYDAGVRESRCRLSAKSREYAAAEDRLQREVETLYATFSEHDQILKIMQDRIRPLAERQIELVMESYRTGRQDFQQLIDAYRTFLEYRIEYYQRIARREQALASLERAVGRATIAPSSEAVYPHFSSDGHPESPEK